MASEVRRTDLHVLLRHRLLPQAHGFEGIGAIEEELLANDSPVGNRQEHGPVAVKPGPAAEAAADDTPAHEEATVPEVEEFSGREPESPHSATQRS